MSGELYNATNGSADLLPKPSSRRIEAAPFATLDPLTFNLNGDRYDWQTDNGTFAIFPPNAHGLVGTTNVSKNNQYIFGFQADGPLYPEYISGQSNTIITAGKCVDMGTNFGYFAIGLGTKSGYALARGEMTTNILTPNDYTTHLSLPTAGLPTAEHYLFLISAQVGSDANGKYVSYIYPSGIFVTDPTQGGTYTMRLDKNGYPAAQYWTFTKEPTVTPTLTSTPTPSATPSITATPDNSPTPSVTPSITATRDNSPTPSVTLSPSKITRRVFLPFITQ